MKTEIKCKICGGPFNAFSAPWEIQQELCVGCLLNLSYPIYNLATSKQLGRCCGCGRDLETLEFPEWMARFCVCFDCVVNPTILSTIKRKQSMI